MERKNTRKIAVAGALTAVAFVLMIFEFPVFLMPSFIKMDFSDLPELIASFSLGPLWGALVCFLKNLLHMPLSQTNYIGELSNFLLGLFFVVPAGWIYKKKKTKKGALLSSFAGSLCMAFGSIIINRFAVYPLYGAVLGFTEEAILSMYRTVLPSVRTLTEALIIFNLPFTFVKGLADVFITFLIYPKLSPILKGKSRR